MQLLLAEMLEQRAPAPCTIHLGTRSCRRKQNVQRMIEGKLLERISLAGRSAIEVLQTLRARDGGTSGSTLT